MSCLDIGEPPLQISFGWFRSLILTLSLANITWSRVLDYKSSTVCDGDAKIINCPRNQLIHVLQSFYGKWSNHDCHGMLTVRDNVPTCKVDRQKSTAIIRDICQGQNSCNLYADDTIYGDPCPSVKKYLYVTYFCMARGGHPHTAPPETIRTTPRPLTTEAAAKTNVIKSEKVASPNPLPSESSMLQSTQPTQAQEDNTAAPAWDNLTLSMPDEKKIIMNSVLRHNIQKSDSSVLAATVCNGERRTLMCKPTERLKVQYAFYGKKNGHDCHGLLPYKDESPTCSALDAKYNVQSKCNDKSSCLLFADESIYGRSLCPHVNKYLHVTYLCQENMLLNSQRSKLTPSEDYEEDAVSRSKIKMMPGAKSTIRVCNGMRKNIQCPPHQTINVVDAFYGKKQGEECRGTISYKDNVPTCRQRSALDSVRFLCHGRQACNLAAQSALFGDDPCPGVNKYLEIEYSC